MLKYLVFALLVAFVVAEQKAIVKITGKAEGSVTFTKTPNGIEISGEITGLTPGKHGFHIHQKGDISEGCASTGGHFNPYQKNHGGPESSERHVGDLGNVEADAKGVAKFTYNDSIISLDGERNIIGRAVVVHAGEDDYGLGGHNDSLTTGHAGDRVGCGIIGILVEGNLSTQLSPIFFGVFLAALTSLYSSI